MPIAQAEAFRRALCTASTTVETCKRQKYMEDDELELGLEDELERALEMEEGGTCTTCIYWLLGHIHSLQELQTKHLLSLLSRSMRKAAFLR